MLFRSAQLLLQVICWHELKQPAEVRWRRDRPRLRRSALLRLSHRVRLRPGSGLRGDGCVQRRTLRSLRRVRSGRHGLAGLRPVWHPDAHLRRELLLGQLVELRR